MELDKTMRIGIITLPLNYNFGGLLQAFALQTTLESMGYSVEIVDTPYPRMYITSNIFKRFIRYFYRLIKKYFLGKKDIRIFREEYFNRSFPIVCQHTNKFIESNLHQRKVNKFSDIKERDYDVLVVGSDQIWRYAFRGHNIINSYLSFAEGWKIKRIAYAPSLGVDYWEYPEIETKECARLLMQFDAISVREKSGVKLIKENFNCCARYVLDPTMLLNANNYHNIAETCLTDIPNNICAVYILDDSEIKKHIVHKIVESKHLMQININAKVEQFDALVSTKDRIQYPVEYWLKVIEHADTVITDSFHACVFSILFHKNFHVIGNKERGLSRIHSLLSMLNLEDRLIDSFEDIENSENINYKNVDDILQSKRKESLEFLRNSLNQ